MIEVLTSFYRLLMPIRPWIVFLLKVDIDPNALDQDNGSSIFPAVLCVSYILFKINHIYSSYLELSQVIVNIYNEQVIWNKNRRIDPHWNPETLSVHHTDVRLTGGQSWPWRHFRVSNMPGQVQSPDQAQMQTHILPWLCIDLARQGADLSDVSCKNPLEKTDVQRRLDHLHGHVVLNRMHLAYWQLPKPKQACLSFCWAVSYWKFWGFCFVCCFIYFKATFKDTWS